jgi:hypothetical protein
MAFGYVDRPVGRFSRASVPSESSSANRWLVRPRVGVQATGSTNVTVETGDISSLSLGRRGGEPTSPADPLQSTDLRPSCS